MKLIVSIFFKVFFITLFFSFGLTSFSLAQSKQMPRLCDMGGVDFSNDPIRKDEDGALYMPVANISHFDQVWKKIFGLPNTSTEGSSYANKHLRTKDLCVDNQAYTLWVVLNIETEGTGFSLEKGGMSGPTTKDNPITQCKPEAMKLSSEALHSLSKSCPFLHLGASQREIKQAMGPPDVQRKSDWYYLRSPTRKNLQTCRRGLKDEDEKECFPAMELNFTNQSLQRIFIHNGHGERW